MKAMELKINTETKTITVTQGINLSELTKFIKKVFKEDWKEWNVISESYPYYYQNPYQIQEPYVTYIETGTTIN